MSRHLLLQWLLVLMTSATCLSAQAQTTVEYIHTDALGSVVAGTNDAGQVIERNDYEPYGAVIGKPSYGGVGFTGHVQDAATGLTYMQQRYYEPAIGRFLSVDPVMAYDNPISGFNRYRYAVNNPYRFTDPDGRIDWEKLGDSFKLALAFGLSLEAKVKLGPVRASLGLGAATYGGGATLAPDGYAFQEVAGPSAALEAGPYAAGWVGSSERSYQGRSGQLYSEEKNSGGAVLGRKKAEMMIEEGGSNGEISGSVGAVIVKATGSLISGRPGTH